MDLLEAAAQGAGVDLVEPFAHPGVRGRCFHAERRAQVPRPDRILATPHLDVELQQGRHLEHEDREARHRAVGQARFARVERVGNVIEAGAHRARHPGHRQMLAEGSSGHGSARLWPALPSG